MAIHHEIAVLSHSTSIARQNTDAVPNSGLELHVQMVLRSVKDKTKKEERRKKEKAGVLHVMCEWLTAIARSAVCHLAVVAPELAVLPLQVLPSAPR